MMTMIRRYLHSSYRTYSSVSVEFDKSEPKSYRLYCVTDDKYYDENLEDKLLECCHGGLDLIQLRLKHATTGAYVAATKSLKARLKREGFHHVPVLVNDRLDVCLAADADGLHLGEDDLEPAFARKLLPAEKILGFSTYGKHDRLKFAKSSEVVADYVAGGGIKPSSTKSFQALGPAPYHKFKTLAGEIPVVAIGGVDETNAFQAIYAGADSLACVSALLESKNPRMTAQSLKASILEAEKAKAKEKFNEICGETVASALAALRHSKPLIHCIANYVSMDIMANVLLASGCSPAMVHTPEEAAEFSKLASAVSINVGTLSPSWVKGMYEAVATIHGECNKPWILDPVAVGAISYRTEVVKKLLKLKPTVLRGNASEILACATLLGIDLENSQSGDPRRGADSTIDSLGVNYAIIDKLAHEIQGVVVMTGAKDYVTDGKRKYFVSHNVPELQLITAAGCSLSSLIAGFVATDSNSDVLRGAIHACAFYSLCAEQAMYERTYQGPGTLRADFIDFLSTMNYESIEALTRIESVP